MVEEPSQHDHIAIGVIVRPHGINGTMRVKVYNADSTLFPAQVKHMAIVTPDGVEYRDLRFKNRVKADVLISCPKIQTPEHVQDLKGSQLNIPKQHIPVNADEFLFADLVGCSVVDADSNTVTGKVVGVDAFGASDILTVRTSDGLKLVPFVDQWVDAVNTKKKIVVIRDLDRFPVSDPLEKKSDAK